MKYNSKTLEHFFNPKNTGSFSADEAMVKTIEVGSYENGVLIQLQIKVNNGVIEAAKFKAYGNVAIIAACSLATEWIRGKTLIDAMNLSGQKLSEELNLPEMKMHCALLVEDALKKVVSSF